MKHTLEADSIQLEFGFRQILADIYIKCETGKITGLLGRNGQGKTCLLRIIYGDLPAGSRSVRLDQQAVALPFKRPDLLGYLPQSNFIPGSLTLQRVFSDFQLDYREWERRFPEFRSSRKMRIRELAGGHRRLVQIYLIVRSKRRFVLLDEPYSHLMPLQIGKVKELLLEEKENKGLLITDHLYQDVLEISDSLYVLVNGKTHLTKSRADIETLGYARL